MTASWETKPLGEVFEFRNGRGFKKAEWSVDGLAIIRIQNLNNTGAAFNYYAGEYDPAILVEPGDLLFSWSGTVGSSFGPHIWNRDPGLLNQHIFRVLPKLPIDPRFAYYSLLVITAEIERQVSGAVGLVHITKERLNRFEIPLPPLEEQKRIVAILDAAFADIDQAERNTHTNTEHNAQIFAEVVQRAFDARGDAWRFARVTDVCTLKSGTSWPKSMERQEGALPYVKVGDMNLVENAKGIVTSSRFVERTAKTDAATFMVGTTIFPKRGGAIATNKKRITKVPICVDLNIIGVTAGPELSSDLLYYYFVGVDLNDIANGSSIPQINNYSFDPLTISFPQDREAQFRLVNRLQAIEVAVDEARVNFTRKTQLLTDLRQSLLHQAFSGQL